MPESGRESARDAFENGNLVIELINVIFHYFPNLFEKLGEVDDPRNKSYTKYSVKVILICRIFMSIVFSKSMREGDFRLNNSGFARTLGLLRGEELEGAPHYDTINDFLTKCDPEQIEGILFHMLKELQKKKVFDGFRVRGNYIHILIDGAQILRFNGRHCEHCLTKTHKKKDGTEWTEYYHIVLEAKIVLGDIVISFMTEYVENEEPIDSSDRSPERKKQDCELNAAYRLLPKIREIFPKLPIVVTCDALMCCEPFFKMCESLGFKYIIRYKSDRIPQIEKEFESADRDGGCGGFIFESPDKWRYAYKFANGIKYKEISTNFIEMRAFQPDGSMSVSYKFVTNLQINAGNAIETVEDGRRRWKVENEGFNVQKNHGYELEHKFSHDYNAIKCHYYLIQIGRALSQFFEKGSKYLDNLKGISVKILHETLLFHLQTGRRRNKT
jgi:hypothetical protein